MEHVLVVGGAGHLGLPVVRELCAQGYKVSVMSRSVRAGAFADSVNLVPGDVNDRGALTAALRNVDRVHVSLSAGSDKVAIEKTEHHGMKTLLQAATSAPSIKQISYLSGMYVRAGLARSVADKAKFAARTAIVNSGIPYTIYRPTYFMETMALQVLGHTAIILGKQRRPIHMIAARDFAAMVVRGFQTPLALHKEFDIRGPQAITFDEAFALYTQHVAPGLRVKHMNLAFMRVMNSLFLKRRLSREIDVMAQMERLGDVPVEHDPVSLLGAATMTVREWCEQVNNASQ